MTEFTKIDVSLKNVQLKQSKKVRLLKYKEPLTYLSFSRSFQIPTKSDATIAYKPFVLEQFLNESLIQRDGIIGNGMEYLPTQVVFSKPFNKYNKGHYYQYNIDEIHNISTVLHGLDFFNMDDLKKSLRKNLNFGKDDVFMVCGYDMFYNVDLRVSFMDDLKKYEIDLYNNEYGVEEIDIWEGVYVSEFIRLFKECDGLEYKKSFISYEDDLLRMSDIKVEFQLFDLLIKYAPLALKSGFDQSQGFKEIDYLNNYMVNGVIKFFELRSDGHELLTIFLNKLIDLMDSHEVYLLLYLNLINHFRLEDDAFMNLTNQAITYFKDPYLIKQYLLLQLSFFERSNDPIFIQICSRISLKLFQLSPTEAFIQLNLIKYIHLTSNSKHDFPDFNLSTDQMITPVNPPSLTHSTSIKNFHFDYLLTEFSNPEVKEVENIKTLTYDHVFHNYPDSKNGYVNFIWDNKTIFEDYVIAEDHFHLKSGNDDMDVLFQEQISMENNKLVTSLLKELITTDEGFLKYILKVITKESSTNVLGKFLKVYKKSLAFVEKNTMNKTMEITKDHYKKLKLLGLSYYFLGLYASCMTVTELLLDQKFDMFVFQIYLKTVENLEDVDITTVLRNIVVALSFENRFYDKVHFKIVKFVKQELMNKRKLSKEYLVNESIQVIDTFINEKLVRMLIDFYNTI